MTEIQLMHNCVWVGELEKLDQWPSLGLMEGKKKQREEGERVREENLNVETNVSLAFYSVKSPVSGFKWRGRF